MLRRRALYPLIPPAPSRPGAPGSGGEGGKIVHLYVFGGKAAKNIQPDPVPRPWGWGKGWVRNMSYDVLYEDRASLHVEKALKMIRLTQRYGWNQK